MLSRFLVALTAVAAVSMAVACGKPPTPSAGPVTDVGAVSSPTPSASPSHVPVTETKTVTETQEIPYDRTTRNDSSLTSGNRVVATQGQAGVRTRTFEVTYVDGVETGRKLVSDVVTKAPVTEVTRVGTKPKSNCDPNYSGACVPIASDVDCAGGSGDGPAYVQGPVYVIGSDIYKLDADHDGVGCE